MLNTSLAERGVTVKPFLGVDPSWWLGYIRHFLVRCRDVASSCTWASLGCPVPTGYLSNLKLSPCYLLIVLLFKMESILKVPSIVIFWQV